MFLAGDKQSDEKMKRRIVPRNEDIGLLLGKTRDERGNGSTTGVTSAKSIATCT
jgi:hypothetical protein